MALASSALFRAFVVIDQQWGLATRRGQQRHAGTDLHAALHRAGDCGTEGPAVVSERVSDPGPAGAALSTVLRAHADEHAAFWPDALSHFCGHGNHRPAVAPD